jgi:hypothetical protein
MIALNKKLSKIEANWVQPLDMQEELAKRPGIVKFLTELGLPIPPNTPRRVTKNGALILHRCLRVVPQTPEAYDEFREWVRVTKAVYGQKK